MWHKFWSYNVWSAQSLLDMLMMSYNEAVDVVLLYVVY